MTHSPSLQRAELLIEQARYEMAEKELRAVLLQEPQHTTALRLLAHCLLETNRAQEAAAISTNLLAIEPDEPYNAYIHAIVQLRLNNYTQAEKYIREAIQMYPRDADFFYILSVIYLEQKQWENALTYANEGLEIDPANLGCLNTRTTALTKLNRKSEAQQTIDYVLEKDPENAWSHTNVGWAKLEQRNHREAQVHFAEALRLQPDMELARAGMLEALKAKNILYRWFLQFFFWLGKHQSQTQWGIIIAFYVGNRILRGMAEKYPLLMIPVVIISFLFYLTWIINPLFNLFLRLDKYGKHVLNERERRGAGWVGVFLGATVLALTAWLISDNDLFLILAVFGGTMVIPFSRLFDAETEKQIQIYKWYTIGLALVGLLGLVGLLLGQPWVTTVGGIYLLGIFAFGWVANALTIR